MSSVDAADQGDDGDLANPKKDQEMMFWDRTEIRQVRGFWYRSVHIRAIEEFRAEFEPRRDDVVILASAQKTGTTWLKALSHSIVSRDDEGEDGLTRMIPQVCVPSFYSMVYSEDPAIRPTDIDQRRLFHTHVPFSYLPDSIKTYARNCKLVYITRDPKDTLISQWHFFNKLFKDKDDNPFPLERAVESFCSGVMPFGPYWEHVLEYWEESKRSPDNVMFVKYEDLHRDTKLYVRKLAAFMGKPFGDGGSGDEEVEKVIWRSSFDRLKDLEVNKTEQKLETKRFGRLQPSHFFRRGEVGDWRNYLTPEMAERVDGITRVKFQGTGLYLEDEG